MVAGWILSGDMMNDNAAYAFVLGMMIGAVLAMVVLEWLL
jgi:tetrahydromethanopterin S-methyltransferase subunit B